MEMERVHVPPGTINQHVVQAGYGDTAYLRMLYPPALEGRPSGGLGHRLRFPIATRLGMGLWSIAPAPL